TASVLHLLRKENDLQAHVTFAASLHTLLHLQSDPQLFAFTSRLWAVTVPAHASVILPAEMSLTVPLPAVALMALQILRHPLVLVVSVMFPLQVVMPVQHTVLIVSVLHLLR